MRTDEGSSTTEGGRVRKVWKRIVGAASVVVAGGLSFGYGATFILPREMLSELFK